ncbi:Docking protein 6 [Dermatophagoides pteronyssinus]|nr:Docking protein 6 [Dermatophagoides pteronyssinus]
MATDLSDVIKQGYMKCKSRSLGLWQKRWIILRRQSTKGPCRLEKYLNEYSARNIDHHHHHQHKIQLLTNVISIDRLSNSQKRHAFEIDFNDGSAKYFACDSDLEADQWIKLMIQECFLPESGISNGEPDVLKPGIQKELQEQFKVYLMPSSKLDIFGECFLQVTHENIYLWDCVNTKQKLCAWPLTALRRYGSDLTKFTFEAGRHCATGEGMFIFHTLEGEKIYRKVHQATLTIAEAHQRMKKQQQQQQTSSSSPMKKLQKNDQTTSLLSKYNDDDDNEDDDIDFEFNQQQQQRLSTTTTNNNNGLADWYHSDNDSIHSSSTTLQSQLYQQHHRHRHDHTNMAMGLEV